MRTYASMSSTRAVPLARKIPTSPASMPVATPSVQVAKQASVPSTPQPSDGGGLWGTWKHVFHAIFSGEHTVVPATLPEFPTLDPSQLAKATQAGQGRTITQPLLSSDAASTHFHDPVNFVIRGSRADLVRSLESQGWMQAAPRKPLNFIKMGLAVLFHLGRDTGAPVSEQYLNGKGEDMAFNKNSDYGRGRDHLRIYYQGKDPKTGQDRWDIAAIRDGGLTLNIPHPQTNGKLFPWQWDWSTPGFSHDADENIDGERDLVMKDMLASGLVKNWAAVDGQLPPGQSKTPTGNGQYMLINRYPTDGKVYEVSLGR